MFLATYIDKLDLAFMKYDTIKQIIKFQFSGTQKLLTIEFVLYEIFFMISFVITVFQDTEAYHSVCLDSCLVAQISLSLIEFIQLISQETWWEYFVGWNIVDVFHMLTFGFIYYLMKYTDLDAGFNSDYLQLA